MRLQCIRLNSVDSQATHPNSSIQSIQSIFNQRFFFWKTFQWKFSTLGKCSVRPKTKEPEWRFWSWVELLVSIWTRKVLKKGLWVLILFLSKILIIKDAIKRGICFKTAAWSLELGCSERSTSGPTLYWNLTRSRMLLLRCYSNAHTL